MTKVAGKRVLVVGLARSGRAAAQCLRRRQALVTVTDLKPPAAFDGELRELVGQKIGLELGLHREETFLRQDLIVLSPGVFPEPPALRAARERKIPVIPEVEAAGWFLGSAIIGVTGSNGKTTTTALLGRMLAASGFQTFVGGNIGVPLISAVDAVSPEALVVAELSSFQLEAIQDFRPHVAVLLNLTPNHLDRHPTFEDYVRAKAQIFRNQTPQDFAILNADDPTVMSLGKEIPSRKVFFSRRRELPDGVFVGGDSIRYRVRNLERVLLETREIALRGEFNVENVLAAAAAACAVGADFAAIRRAVREFRAVEHRLEFVREIGGVDFFNDSKATSVDATAKALSAFPGGVHLILGGKDKGAPYAPLRPLVQRRVRLVYVIGAAAERIAKELAGTVEIIRAGDLATAVREAFGRALAGDTVLLSPACASFDQFHDFEDRGCVFKALVEALAQEAERRGFDRRQEGPSVGALPAVSPGPPEPEPPASLPEAPEPPEAGIALLALASAAPEVFELPGVPSAAPEEATAAASQPEELAAPAEPEATGRAESEIEEPSTTEVAESDSAAPETEQVKEPAEPEPPIAPQVRTRELAYVYEVSAEETAYAEASTAFPEGTCEPLPAEELRRPDELADEALPFEARPGSSPAKSQKVSPQEAAPAQELPADTPDLEDSSGGRRRQGRLPGL